jgi:hypothetical protein
MKIHMKISSTVEPSSDNFDEIINETLAGVSDAFDMICGSRGGPTAGLTELHEVLPALDPSEARFITLLLTACKCRLIGERALDLLVEQHRAAPSLDELMNDLAAPDGVELPDQRYA